MKSISNKTEVYKNKSILENNNKKYLEDKANCFVLIQSESFLPFPIHSFYR